MRFRREARPFPNYLGTPHPGNVFATVCWQLGLAVAGVAIFGIGSAAAFAMSIPLLFKLPSVLVVTTIRCAANVFTYPHWSPLHFLSIGPVTIRTSPFRMNVDWDTRHYGSLGMYEPRWPALEVDFNRVKRRIKFFMAVALIPVVLLVSVGFYAMTNQVPWQIAPIAFVLGVHAAALLLRLKFWKIAIDECTKADHPIRILLGQFLPLSHSDRLYTLSDDEIGALIQEETETGLALSGCYAAYRALGSQGRIPESADILKRAVILADQLRRQPYIVDPAIANHVYHDAAFLAAAYAGDLDFAIRAIASSGISQVDKTGYHLAMAAIWLRSGHWPEARASFEQAKRARAFWQEPGGRTPYDFHFVDMERVFDTADLQTLANQGIRSDFFAELERPAYGRAPGISIVGIRCVQAAVLGIMVMLNIGARSAENSVNGTENFEIDFALPAFIFVAILYAMQPRARSIAEYTRDGLAIRGFLPTLWIPMTYIRRLTWDRHGRRICSIEIDRECAKQDGGKIRLPKSVDLSQFKETWPGSSPEETLACKAPHLFAGTSPVEDPRRAA
jgi:hypothetical protein